MGRKPLPPNLKKKKLTIALPKWLIEKLRNENNYNKLIYDALVNYLKNDNK